MSKHKPDWDADDEPAKPEPETAVPGKLVRVRCISHGTPHTGVKGLAHGEEADVPQDVAKAMVEKEQVEIV